jgi:hypothetical protein
VNDLNAKQSTRRFDVMSVVVGLTIVAAAGLGVLARTERMSRVLAALAMIFGIAAAVTGWREMRRSKEPSPVADLHAELYTRRSGLTSIAVGLFFLTGTPQALVDPNRTGRVMGIFVSILGMVALVLGGFALWQSQKRRS